MVHHVGNGKEWGGLASFKPLKKIGFICGDQGTQLKSPAIIRGVLVWA